MLDFEYDGVCLSDLGYIICSFDDMTSLKFKEFDFSTLGGGSNGAKP